MTAPTVTCQLQMQNADHLFDQIMANTPHARQMVWPAKSRVGKTLTVCGAGPSLASPDVRHWMATTPTDEVWGCNSALPYLMDQGLRVTHGFTVDQGDAMLGPDEWARTFDLPYLVATSVHPALVAHLEAAGRSLTWFHNYLGIPNPPDWTPPAGWVKQQPDWGYEMWLYQTQFPPSVQLGYGLNSAVRAICLGMWLAFDRVYVVGADCAAAPDQAPMPVMHTPAYDEWLKTVPLYAAGRTVFDAYGSNAVMTEATIQGRRWATRTDMLVSAQHMVDIVRHWGERVVLLGDTLPNALLGVPETLDVNTREGLKRMTRAEYYAMLPKLAGGGAVTGFALHRDLEAQLVALDNSGGLPNA